MSANPNVEERLSYNLYPLTKSQPTRGSGLNLLLVTTSLLTWLPHPNRSYDQGAVVPESNLWRMFAFFSFACRTQFCGRQCVKVRTRSIGKRTRPDHHCMGAIGVSQWVTGSYQVTTKISSALTTIISWFWITSPTPLVTNGLDHKIPGNAVRTWENLGLGLQVQH